ncbi:VIT domain-containing protein [Pseudoxanthomonas putridarboris]|uniref:VIT domain-containing protein n=1 Tax=Pseudoxanthomonas putridarboris TaxID=752605 RepID=A0ABU9J1Q6_9GAMM
MKSIALVSAGMLALAAIAALAQARTEVFAIVPPLLEVRGAETPVVLREAGIDTVVVGGLAQTTVDLVFFNPNARDLEGHLDFPLRDGQRITGFALDFDGHLRPAVPVEKAKGQQVFEAIERRQVDPALLEQTAGNHFRLRIFPIPAGDTRRVRLTYVEPLSRETAGSKFARASRDGGMGLSLPLDYARGAESVALRIRVQGEGKPVMLGQLGAVAFERRGNAWEAHWKSPALSGGDRDHVVRRAAPFRGGDLRLSVPRRAQPQVHVQLVDGQAHFLAEIPVDDVAVVRALPGRIGLLWDSSGSARKRDVESELAVLDAYFRAAGDIEVSLVRLRDRAEPAQAFRVRGGDWSALRQALRDTVYDGASNLGDWSPRDDIPEYLLFSDGLGNYGAQSFPQLAAGQRLYALHAAGSHADDVRLRAWAEASDGGQSIAIAAPRLADATRALLHERPRLLSEQLPGGAELVRESSLPRDGMFRVAGLLREDRGTLTMRYRQGNGHVETVELPVDGRDALQEGPIGQLWAGYWVDRLSADPDVHRARIRELGGRYRLVTPETSLIVLETVEDYVRYDIAPPEELREAFAELKAEQTEEAAEDRQARIDEVAEAFAEKIAWWNAKPSGVRRRESVPEQADVVAVAAPPPVATPAAPPPPQRVLATPPAPALERRAQDAVATAHAEAAESAALREVTVIGSVVAEPEAESSKEMTLDAVQITASTGKRIGIALQPWEPDSPYARRLREAAPERIYALYLDERDAHADSTAFYLDVADLLFLAGQDALALRVLSNLAELQLENRHILRVLAYRLMQAGQPALAVPLFEQVRRLAPEEPQSFRDLGLAYAAVGQPQQAVDALYEVVTGDWDGRFGGIQLIALAELNDVVVNATQRPDTRRTDPRLLKHLPLDLRVVLAWDSDNSDMDLWVTDPDGEKCYYNNPLTAQGGRLSDDFTGGYGPEEFSLRKAKPGKYTVEANFFGDRQQLVTGATTLQLKLTTGFGTPQAKEQRVTLRLKEQSETVLVGEFQVE